jgi:hypothetical protein
MSWQVLQASRGKGNSRLLAKPLCTQVATATVALVTYRRCFRTALVKPQRAQVKVGQAELLATQRSLQLVVDEYITKQYFA